MWRRDILTRKQEVSVDSFSDYIIPVPAHGSFPVFGIDLYCIVHKFIIHKYWNSIIYNHSNILYLFLLKIIMSWPMWRRCP
jgi:hypothetical protein